MGGHSNGIARYDGNEFQIFTNKDGLLTHEVTSFWEDNAGVLWFGTEYSGIWTYDGIKFGKTASREDLGLGFVTDIIGDRSGYLWFSGLYSGVRRYDGKSFTRFTIENGLPSNTCFALCPWHSV
ncbi:hypothetical protein H8E77_01680 [bacterium]|nr:hypothetical protein [bacterium]